MTSDRFTFQRECAARVTGRILNVGCKEDPAGLQSALGARVVNLDIRDEDEDKLHNHGQHVPIPVDVIHDATIVPWPFEDASFDLVVLGDMLEDLPDNGCQLTILREARRIAESLCLTCPEDGPERDAHHQTRITEARLKGWLDAAGWEPVTFQVVDYGFVPRGYFVYALRSEPLAQPPDWGMEEPCEATSSSSTKPTSSPASSNGGQAAPTPTSR